MIEKRYFKREWEEEYYIFDSQTISENEFDEKLEYEDYQAFQDSMSGDEVVNRLNELHEENQKMKKNGLKVLHFYEDKLKNSNKEDFQSVRDELWIVKEVLIEMEVLE